MTFRLLMSNFDIPGYEVKVFNSATYRSPADVSVTGEKFVLALYGGQRLATLDEYMYYMILSCMYCAYNRNIASKSFGATFTLAAAAGQHSLRTYLQVQLWLERDLPPTE